MQERTTGVPFPPLRSGISKVANQAARKHVQVTDEQKTSKKNLDKSTKSKNTKKNPKNTQTPKENQ